MKKLTLVYAVAGWATLASWGHDLIPPSWSRLAEPRTTFQTWQFTNSNPFPAPSSFQSNPSSSVNDMGGTLVVHNGTWLPNYDGLSGVWALTNGGSMEMYLPNFDNLNPKKIVHIQLTWAPNPANLSATPYFDTIFPQHDDLRSSGERLLGIGLWGVRAFDITWLPNPAAEGFTVRGDGFISQIVVDTICVPEPSTLSLGLLGAFAVALYRRNSRPV